MVAAFRAYASTGYNYSSYDRSTPFHADIVEFDRSGEFNTTYYAFQASQQKYMRFTFNMLFQNVVDTALLTPCLFISTNSGSTWNEIAGTDIGGSSTSTSPQNQGAIITRSIFLNQGDMVRAHPCISTGGYLINSGGSGYVKCNYFEGEEI